MRSPRWPTAFSAKRSEALDGLVGRPSPPSATAQRGVVKWWKVTTGSTPWARQEAHTRR